MQNRRLQQADAAQPLLLRRFHQTPNAFRKHLGHRDAIDPRCRVEQTPHTAPFHSEGGMGSGETGRVTPRCLPAPKKVRTWLAGTIRTYGLPKRVTNNSSPLATEPRRAGSLRNEPSVTVFMPDTLPKGSAISKHHFPLTDYANCAKSFVTRKVGERAAEAYVAPEVGLPWQNG